MAQFLTFILDQVSGGRSYEQVLTDDIVGAAGRARGHIMPVGR